MNSSHLFNILFTKFIVIYRARQAFCKVQIISAFKFKRFQFDVRSFLQFETNLDLIFSYFLRQISFILQLFCASDSSYALVK